MPFFDNVLLLCYGRKRRKGKEREGRKREQIRGREGEKKRGKKKKKSYYFMFLLLLLPRIEKYYSTKVASSA